MVVDSAIACAMERTDLVLLGTESVTENGGLVSQVGTYQVAMIAKAARRPCYAVAERYSFGSLLKLVYSYKFIRRLPLGQTDLPMDAPTALHETKASRASLNDASFEEFDVFYPHHTSSSMLTNFVVVTSQRGLHTSRIYSIADYRFRSLDTSWSRRRVV